MAGDWFPWSHGLTRRREVALIAAETGRDRWSVAGGLAALWEWFSEESTDGKMPGVTATMLTSCVGGDDALWKAVAAVGWLLLDDSGARIPNWEKWMGKSAKRRLKENLRKRGTRSILSASCPQDVRKVSACDADKLRPKRESERRDGDPEVFSVDLSPSSPERGLDSETPHTSPDLPREAREAGGVLGSPEIARPTRSRRDRELVPPSDLERAVSEVSEYYSAKIFPGRRDQQRTQARATILQRLVDGVDPERLKLAVGRYMLELTPLSKPVGARTFFNFHWAEYLADSWAPPAGNAGRLPGETIDEYMDRAFGPIEQNGAPP